MIELGRTRGLLPKRIAFGILRIQLNWSRFFFDVGQRRTYHLPLFESAGRGNRGMYSLTQ